MSQRRTTQASKNIGLVNKRRGATKVVNSRPAQASRPQPVIQISASASRLQQQQMAILEQNQINLKKHLLLARRQQHLENILSILEEDYGTINQIDDLIVRQEVDALFRSRQAQKVLSSLSTIGNLSFLRVK